MRSTITTLILIVPVVAVITACDRFEAGRGGPDSPDLTQEPTGSPEAIKAEMAEAMAAHESYPFDFTLPSTDGQTVSKADFAGRVMIVDIWGTWCPPCRAEVPHFVELQDEYREEGLSIVGINYEQAASREEVLQAIAEFTSEIPVNYPLLLGDQATQQQIPDFQAFPTTLFIDRDGRVRLTLVGLHSKAALKSAVQLLLEE